MKAIKNIIIIVAVGIACLLNADTAQAQMSEYKFNQLFDQAFEYVVDGNHDQAVTILKRLNKADANHAQVSYLYALAKIKTTGASKATESLLENAVKNYDYFHQSGRVEDRSAPVKAWFYLARSYAVNNKYDKAIEAYRNYMSCVPMASIEHKRGIVGKIKMLKRQKLAASGGAVSTTLASKKP